MKILLSAFACHPNRGSECAVGWNWLKELSKKNKVWVLFDSTAQKEDVKEAVSKLSYRDNIRLIPLDYSKSDKKILRMLYSSIGKVHYISGWIFLFGCNLWQLEAYKAAKDILKNEDIDLIHHVSYVSWANCGYLWKLNRPFFFGPISGAQKTPRAGYSFLTFRGKITEFARTLSFNILWHLWSRPKKAIKKAEVVFAANKETELKVKHIRKNAPVILFNELGTNKINKNLDIGLMKSKTETVNLLWVASLIPRKNFGLLLEALNMIPKGINWSLRVIGDGPLSDYWKKRAGKYGLKNKINFLGNIDYSKMGEQYQLADMFVFPSLREATGTVLVEAMSHSLPVIALNLHGAKIVLDGNCAVLIPAKDKEQMVRDFSDAIIKLAKNPRLRKKMGEAGMKRAEKHFLWEKRGVMMNKIYHKALKREQCFNKKDL